MKTYSVKPSDINREWVVVDAAGQPLGRLATEISRVLRGKHKATFVPHLACGDNVLVINAKDVKLTGNKWLAKKYYSHSGYIGGIKDMTADEMRTKHPERLVEIAVKGMLPKNKLSNKLLKGLRVYSGADHRHTAQAPKAMPPRTAQS